MKNRRVIKRYRMTKEFNPFDNKYKFIIRDEEDKITFAGTMLQTLYAFADRLTDSGHTVYIDDTVNMSDEQLDDLRELEAVEGV